MIIMLSDDVLTLVDSWSERGWLRPLDRAFIRFLGNMVPEAPSLVLLAGALASHQLGRGHVCLDLDAALNDPDSTLSLPPEGESGESMPARPSQILSGIAGISKVMWEESLLSCPDLVATGHGNTPLVLDNGRLYLRRYWHYTSQVAKEILRRLELSFSVPDNLPQRLDKLFFLLRSETEREKKEIHWQSVATALAAKSGFTIISGGPGTGKTTTVVQILALLQGMALEDGQKLRINLAAPTGKAAARLTESIGGAVNRLPDDIKDALPTDVSTIHKLLGSRANTRHFIHTKYNKLHLDLLVVDEASMVDLEMMAAILEALPDKARLILLGDKDQLSSVEAGSVLGDLCRNSEQDRYTADTRLWIEQHTGYLLKDSAVDETASSRSEQEFECMSRSNIDMLAPQSATAAPQFHSNRNWPTHLSYLEEEGLSQSDKKAVESEYKIHKDILDQHIVVLRKSHRFGDDSGIGALARAVNSGDAEKVEEVWQKRFKDIGSVSIENTDDKAFARLILDSGYRSYLEKVHKGPANGLYTHPERRLDDLPENRLNFDEQKFNRQQVNVKKRGEDPRKNDALAHSRSVDLWIEDVLNEFSRFQLLTPLRKGPWGVEGLNKKTAEILYKEGLISSMRGWYPGRPVMLLCNDYSLGLMNGDVGILLPLMGEFKVVFPMPDNSFKKVLPSRLNYVETVYAMTVHKSQGSEFEHTAMVLPDRMNPVLTRELLYTGITRAKSCFTLVTPKVNLLSAAVKRRTHRASGLGDMLYCS